LIPAISWGQQPSSPDALVQSLLAEIRRFRLALERSASLLPARDSMEAQIKDLESEAQLDPGRRSHIEMAKKNVASQIEMQALREQQERVPRT